MQTFLRVLCVFLLVCFLVPVILGLSPIPLDVKMQSVEKALDGYFPFPEFPSFTAFHLFDLMDQNPFLYVTSRLNPVRYTLYIAEFSIWMYQVSVWFVSDIWICLKALSAICLNVIYT